MITQQNFHSTPSEIYQALVSLFGEDAAFGDGRDDDTRWVKFGAGPYDLVFFPARDEA